MLSGEFLVYQCLVLSAHFLVFGFAKVAIDIRELKRTGARWSSKEISTENPVDMSADNMSVYQAIINKFHVKEEPICESNRVASARSAWLPFSHSLLYKRRSVEGAHVTKMRAPIGFATIVFPRAHGQKS